MVLEQIDGAVHIGDRACLFECKDERERANIEPFAKLRNQLLRRPAGVVGNVVSVSGFTGSAITLAGFMAPQCILLWEGDELAYLIERKLISCGRGSHFTEALRMKLRMCIQRGDPAWNVARSEALA